MVNIKFEISTQGIGDTIFAASISDTLKAMRIAQITDIALLPQYLTHDNALLRRAAAEAYDRIMRSHI